jgi:hypothetical protein
MGEAAAHGGLGGPRPLQLVEADAVPAREGVDD